MKANQKFLHEEEAVSPVIAVILMVAITVVLAATVFVLVNDLGKNVGQTGPSLGLVSDSAQSSTSQWTVKVSSATKLSDLTDYRFVFGTSDQGQVIVTPTSNAFTTPQVWFGGKDGDSSDGYTANRTDAHAAYTGTAGAYRLTFTDIDGNSKWSVGDTLAIAYDNNDAASLMDNTFPSGEYALEILHTPSGSSSGSLPRTF